MPQPLISLRGVRKSFGSQKVLDGLDLDVERGETLVVLGPSGTGKSVLLKLIAGLLAPDAGQVLFDLPLRGPEDPPRIGFLFQGAALFDSLTVEENVTFALRRFSSRSRDELRAVAEERLAWVGLKGVLDKKPAQLSGGMRKRVGLARAIATDPPILLYDEPTTGLDPIMSDAINQLIVGIQRRTHATAVAVTHDMASAYKIGDRLALIYGGRLVASAEPAAFRELKDPMVQQFIHGRAEGPIQLM
jgi:phospholipid/cholesterol/gamma-HCH transport system ATP-binding protein